MEAIGLEEVLAFIVMEDSTSFDKAIEIIERDDQKELRTIAAKYMEENSKSLSDIVIDLERRVNEVLEERESYV